MSILLDMMGGQLDCLQMSVSSLMRSRAQPEWIRSQPPSSKQTTRLEPPQYERVFNEIIQKNLEILETSNYRNVVPSITCRCVEIK